MNEASRIYRAEDLLLFCTQMLRAVGVRDDIASTVAATLLEGDLMGHTTHGLQLLGPYLKQLADGTMTATGEPSVVSDRGSAITWDGHYLPGPWLVHSAIELAFLRLPDHPVTTVVIRRSHHLACLSAYLTKATDRGYLMLLLSSDPATRTVAPYGGTKPIYTPNPIAAGIPTAGDPILIDTSMSCTTNGFAQRCHASGEPLAGEWLLDSTGNLSSDPSVLFTDPPGSILPLGGIELGYKGFSLGVLVEALSAALGGYGRGENPSHWGASVFLQLIDPEAFGGRAAFTGETEWLAEACRTNPPRNTSHGVRLPGSRALCLREKQLAEGVELHPAILPSTAPWAEKLGVSMPHSIRENAGKHKHS